MSEADILEPERICITEICMIYGYYVSILWDVYIICSVRKESSLNGKKTILITRNIVLCKTWQTCYKLRVLCQIYYNLFLQGWKVIAIWDRGWEGDIRAIVRVGLPLALCASLQGCIPGALWVPHTKAAQMQDEIIFFSKNVHLESYQGRINFEDQIVSWGQAYRSALILFLGETVFYPSP